MGAKFDLVDENGFMILNNRQRLFAGVLAFTLVDLLVLGLVGEYWDQVYFKSFTYVALTALMLQALLRVLIVLEGKWADYCRPKTSKTWKVIRGFGIWVIVGGGKWILLGVSSLVFGENVQFKGAWHGTVSFIVTIIAVIIVEAITRKILITLSEKDVEEPIEN